MANYLFTQVIRLLMEYQTTTLIEHLVTYIILYNNTVEIITVNTLRNERFMVIKGTDPMRTWSITCRPTWGHWRECWADMCSPRAGGARALGRGAAAAGAKVAA